MFKAMEILKALWKIRFGSVKINNSYLGIVVNILHEVLHVLGFQHEHQRPDREEYIRINMWNIKEKWRHWFKKEKFYHTTLDSEYDLESLMHYQANVGMNELMKERTNERMNE